VLGGLVWPAAAIVLIDDAGLTRCHEHMVRDDLAGERLEAAPLDNPKRDMNGRRGAPHLSELER